MSGKLIRMEHKVCDYTCMWNGIEDLYHSKTGVEVPDYFFFCLSGIGDFIYLKFNSGELRRMAMWGDGRTKQMYQKICNTVGFTFKYIEGRKFEYTLKRAKEQIDKGCPIVLGCLDMYYLGYYPKFHYKTHIPIHYVLMVGYDDNQQVVYIQDCGVPDVQKLSYTELEKALNVEETTLSDKNAICCVDFSGRVNDIRKIAINGFQAKAHANLHPRVSFTGINGMRKLAKEIGEWQKQLTEEEYNAALINIATFTGTVPLMPERQKGCDINKKDGIKHQALRDKLGELLVSLGKQYSFDEWINAGELFLKSGNLIQNMTDIIVEYLFGCRDGLNDLGSIVIDIADLEEKAYVQISKGPM